MFHISISTPANTFWFSQRCLCLWDAYMGGDVLWFICNCIVSLAEIIIEKILWAVALRPLWRQRFSFPHLLSTAQEDLFIAAFSPNGRTFTSYSHLWINWGCNPAPSLGLTQYACVGSTSLVPMQGRQPAPPHWHYSFWANTSTSIGQGALVQGVAQLKSAWQRWHRKSGQSMTQFSIPLSSPPPMSSLSLLPPIQDSWATFSALEIDNSRSEATSGV